MILKPHWMVETISKRYLFLQCNSKCLNIGGTVPASRRDSTSRSSCKKNAHTWSRCFGGGSVGEGGGTDEPLAALMSCKVCAPTLYTFPDQLNTEDCPHCCTPPLPTVIIPDTLIGCNRIGKVSDSRFHLWRMLSFFFGILFERIRLLWPNTNTPYWTVKAHNTLWWYIHVPWAWILMGRDPLNDLYH